MKSSSENETQQPSSLQDVIEILSKDIDMIRFVENRLATILGPPSSVAQVENDENDEDDIEEDRKLPARTSTVAAAASTSTAISASFSKNEITQQVLRNILSNNIISNSSNCSAKKQPPSKLRKTSRSRSRSPLSLSSHSALVIPSSIASTSQNNSTPLAASQQQQQQQQQQQPNNFPPVKTVSFSSVSVPPPEDVSQQNQEFPQIRLPSRRSSASISPPPPNYYSPPHSIRSSSPVAFGVNRLLRNANIIQPRARRTSGGEGTASGDSSVSSQYIHHHSNNSQQQHVHFSAMNPNPQLVLDSTSSTFNHQQQQPNRVVSFTFNRRISWDEPHRNNSRTSSLRASGRSSPSIEPALSPIATRSPKSHIQFNLDAMEVITEAAARLRAQHNQDISPETNNVNLVEEENSIQQQQQRQREKVVHFSARKETVGNVSGHSENQQEQLSSPVNTTITTTHTEAEMERVANRLRHLIRRAEERDNITLFEAFKHFDKRHKGTITAQDLQEGLSTLGFSNDFTLYECEVLLSCLRRGQHNNNRSEVASGNEDGIHLFGFYRAMGRSSPPPPASLTRDDLHNFDVVDDNDETIGQENRSEMALATTTLQLQQPLQQQPYRLASSPVVHANDAASRLRAIILSTERQQQSQHDDHVESYFRLLDHENTGHISASDFRNGLRKLSASSNSFSLLEEEDCEELVNLFDTNNDGLVSLVDFYRFMGRRSPPPLADVEDHNSDHINDADMEE